jgi:hypothetical protein
MLYCHTSVLRKHRKVVSIFWRFFFLKKQFLFAAVLNVVNKNLSLRKTFPYKCLSAFPWLLQRVQECSGFCREKGLWSFQTTFHAKKGDTSWRPNVQVNNVQTRSDYLCDTHGFISVSLPFVVFASSCVQSSQKVLVDFKTCILHPSGHVHNNSIATSSSQTIVKLPKMFSTLRFKSFVFHQAMNPLEVRAEFKDLLHPFCAQEMHPNCASLIEIPELQIEKNYNWEYVWGCPEGFLPQK